MYYEITPHVMRSCICVHVYDYVPSNNTEYLQLYEFCWHMYILHIVPVFVYICCSVCTDVCMDVCILIMPLLFNQFNFINY